MDIDKIDLVGHLNLRSPEAFVYQKYLQAKVRTASACSIVVQTFGLVVDILEAVDIFVAVGMLIDPSWRVIVRVVVLRM